MTQLSSQFEMAPLVPTGVLFGHTRDYLNNRFVYAVVSQRAGGLSIGVNLTPDRKCNFDCIYCEVNHKRPSTPEPSVNVDVLSAELAEMLRMAREDRFARVPWLKHLPPELLQLKEVALSGDGEPTLCPNFHDAVEAVVHRRAQENQHFKIVLITNATGLARPEVERGLQLFTRHDEVWVKLDAGTQGWMDRINRPGITLNQALENILNLARKRPVIIQSLFPQIGSAEPPPSEIAEYVARLRELKEAGAQITLVQVYSAHRPPHRPDCGHLPLRSLSEIARQIRQVSGLRAEVF